MNECREKGEEGSRKERRKGIKEGVAVGEGKEEVEEGGSALASVVQTTQQQGTLNISK